MTDTRFDKFSELINRFDHAMLVTRRNHDLRSRPMAIADIASDGRIRFITRDDSAKLGELDENDQVNVSMQGEARFLSISGHARLSKDPELIDKAWGSNQEPWFSGGRDDPHVIVLEVIPTYAEYWDRSSGDVLEVAFDKARAAFGSEEGAHDNPDEHGDINFRRRDL